MEQLETKVAVVTGAASGIGRAIASAFAVEGMRLVLADVETEPLEQVAAELRAAGSEAEAVPTDVADGKAVDRLAEIAWDRFGSVHVVCNNAGVFQGGLCWELADADWEWAFGVNTWGIINGIRAFVPRLLAQGEQAHVVNTASMAGLIAMPYSGPYVTSKFAAYALSECLAHDLAAVAAPIGVSVLCPSLVATGIGTSERNRPGALAGEQTESVSFVTSALADSVADGMAPADAASAVVAAVRNDVFLVPTKPSFETQIRGHSEALLRRELPGMPVID